MRVRHSEGSTARLVAAAACLAACSVVLVAGPINPPAGPVQSTQLALDDVEPRTPLIAKFVSSGFGAIFNIAQPGHYYLTEDLLVTTGIGGINVGVDDLTIDLNGFTIRGASGSLTGIRNSSPRNNTVVRNGFIDSEQAGIQFASGSSKSVIENVHIDSQTTGISALTRAVIRNTVNVAIGQAVREGDSTTVVGNTFVGLTGTVGLFAAGEHVVIEHNTFKDLGVSLSIGADRGAVVTNNTFINVLSATSFVNPTGNLVGPADSTLTSTSPYANVVLP